MNHRGQQQAALNMPLTPRRRCTATATGTATARDDTAHDAAAVTARRVLLFRNRTTRSDRRTGSKRDEDDYVDEESEKSGMGGNRNGKLARPPSERTVGGSTSSTNMIIIHPRSGATSILVERDPNRQGCRAYEDDDEIIGSSGVKVKMSRPIDGTTGDDDDHKNNAPVQEEPLQQQQQRDESRDVEAGQHDPQLDWLQVRRCDGVDNRDHADNRRQPPSPPSASPIRRRPPAAPAEQREGANVTSSSSWAPLFLKEVSRRQRRRNGCSVELHGGRGARAQEASRLAVTTTTPRRQQQTTTTTLAASMERGEEYQQPSCDRGGGANFRPYKLLFGAAGIYAAYLLYGHYQEDLFASGFSAVWSLQVIESSANVVVGLIGLIYCHWRKQERSSSAPTMQTSQGSSSPLQQSPPAAASAAAIVLNDRWRGLWNTARPFFQSGCSQLMAKALLNFSLAAGLSFPVCTLCKSAKLLPVMVGQVLWAGKKNCAYRARDFWAAAAICTGAFMVSLGGGGGGKGGSKGGSHADANAATTTSVAGVLFILLSLCMDGITAGLQKKLLQTRSNQKLPPPTALEFLFFTNASMVLWSLVLSVSVGDYKSAYSLAFSNAAVRRCLFWTCAASAAGQLFVFYCIANFDPAVLAAVTTSRKMLSVLWSCLAKGHPLSLQGRGGLLVACAALMVQVQSHASRGRQKKQQQRRKQQQQHQEQEEEEDDGHHRNDKEEECP